MGTGFFFKNRGKMAEREKLGVDGNSSPVL
jgi:hypothetical protein